MRPTAMLTILIGALLLATTVHAVDADAADADAPPDTVALAKLTPEELFLRASSAALQFESMRAPSRRILVREYEDSIPYLVTQLDTDGPRERHALEDLFVRIGEHAVEPLIDAFREELAKEETTRGVRMAAGILGKLEDGAAVPALVEAKEHPNWKVRSSVAGALGRIGDPGAVPALLSLLEDENEIVRKGAGVSLKRTAEKAEEGDAPGEDVVASLVDALDDRYYSVRYSAADALAAIGEPAIPALRAAAGPGGGPEALLAIRALGAIGSTDSLKFLRELLASDSWVVRAAAAEAAGRIGPDWRTVDALERMLEEEEHPFVVLRVAEALESEEG